MGADTDTSRRPGTLNVANGASLPDALQQLLRDGEAELVAEIITIFKQETAGRLQLLSEAIERRQLPEVRIQAHGIKGGASQVGADDLAAVCLEIEQSDGLPWDQITALLGCAQLYYERACGMIE